MTTTIDPTSLAAKMAAAKQESVTQAQNTELQKSDETKDTKEVGHVEKSYQLPSSNCTISLSEKAGGPVVSYDSVFTTSDPAQIEELDKMVRVGNISYAQGRSNLRQHTPAEPVARSADRNNGTVI